MNYKALKVHNQTKQHSTAQSYLPNYQLVLYIEFQKKKLGALYFSLILEIN
jgi:hypothetical protein